MSNAKKRSGRKFLYVLLPLFVVAYFATTYVMPLPQVQPSLQATQLKAADTQPLVWPKTGQAALGALGYGILDSHGEDKPVPMASIAKVLTALAVLRQKPLLKGEQGPVITITAEDVATYQKYLAANGSLVPVKLGEQLSEYQALQALLLPSANNIADLLVKWAFGTEANYVTFANSFVKSLGLDHTIVADASGFLPQTVSTAKDLVLLGTNIMDNPVLAEIVAQPEATIPVAGVISNVNLLLGNQEIVGIKTGNTDEAGGCYLFAAKHDVERGYEVTIIGVVMAAPDLASAILSSLPLLKSSYQNFSLVKAVNKGQVVASYNAPWGGTAKASASKDILGISWKSKPPKVTVDLQPLSATNAEVKGEIYAQYGRNKVSSPLTLDTRLTYPSLTRRLLHPFGS